MLEIGVIPVDLVILFCSRAIAALGNEVEIAVPIQIGFVSGAEEIAGTRDLRIDPPFGRGIKESLGGIHRAVCRGFQIGGPILPHARVDIAEVVKRCPNGILVAIEVGIKNSESVVVEATMDDR